VVAIKIYELISTLEDRVRAQNGVYKPEMVPEISWGWSWEGEVKCGAGNAWRSDIVKKDLGIKRDCKPSAHQQRQAFVAENPDPEPEPSLGDALTGALEACSLISFFSSVMMKPD